MDAKNNNMWCLNVFKEVPHLSGKNIIMLKWVFRCKYKNGSLTGVDYCKAHLYAPVVHLESFHMLISIATLFDHDPHQFDVSAAYLHVDINREAYMEPPPGYEWEGSVWLLQKGQAKAGQ